MYLVSQVLTPFHVPLVNLILQWQLLRDIQVSFWDETLCQEIDTASGSLQFTVHLSAGVGTSIQCQYNGSV